MDTQDVRNLASLLEEFADTEAKDAEDYGTIEDAQRIVSECYTRKQKENQ